MDGLIASLSAHLSRNLFGFFAIAPDKDEFMSLRGDGMGGGFSDTGGCPGDQYQLFIHGCCLS